MDALVGFSVAVTVWVCLQRTTWLPSRAEAPISKFSCFSLDWVHSPSHIPNFGIDRSHKPEVVIFFCFFRFAKLSLNSEGAINTFISSAASCGRRASRHWDFAGWWGWKGGRRASFLWNGGVSICKWSICERMCSARQAPRTWRLCSTSASCHCRLFPSRLFLPCQHQDWLLEGQSMIFFARN